MKFFYAIAFTLMLTGCGDAPEKSAGQTEKPVAASTSASNIPTIVDVNPLNDPTPLSEMISFVGLGPGGHITSPYTLRGRAVSGWYFEGSFPVQLLAEDGTVIAEAPAAAQEDWMQEGWVPYRATLKWNAKPDTKAKLVLSLDNPAEEGEGKRRALEIPVVLK